MRVTFPVSTLMYAMFFFMSLDQLMCEMRDESNQNSNLLREVKVRT